jgi:hypothetical protein
VGRNGRPSGEKFSLPRKWKLNAGAGTFRGPGQDAKGAVTLMVEAQGSIGQRADGNVGTLATDSIVEKALRLGPSTNELDSGACVATRGVRRGLTTRGNRSR